MSFIISKLRWRRFYRSWKKNNAHNSTSVQSYFDINRVKVGRFTYGMINAHTYSGDRNITIGDFCSISENVHFVLGEHDYKRVSTFPFDKYVLNEAEPQCSKGDIIVEDDVWIGMNCTILSGVTIHRGAIIGAGSIVNKDVPPYTIYAGGRIVKKRFDEDIIEKLMSVDYSKLSFELVKEYREYLYSDVECFINSDLYELIQNSDI